MKILFAGTPTVAADCLNLLLQKQIEGDFEIVGVLTSPDAPFGRNRKLTPSPVKQLAIENELPIFESLNDATNNSGAELGVIVAYGKLLKKSDLNALKHGWVNLHFSILPQLRGAAPVQRAIERADKETGVTVFELTEELDAGPIYSQTKVPIFEAETTGELFNRLTAIGVDAIVESIKKVDQGFTPIEQTGNPGEYAAKLLKDDARINWEDHCEKIANKINAYSPNPGAWFELHVRDKEPQRIVAIKAKVENNEVKLLRVKPAGKQEMDADSWLRGLSNLKEWKFA